MAFVLGGFLHKINFPNGPSFSLCNNTNFHFVHFDKIKVCIIETFRSNKCVLLTIWLVLLYIYFRLAISYLLIKLIFNRLPIKQFEALQIINGDAGYSFFNDCNIVCCYNNNYVGCQLWPITGNDFAFRTHRH